MNPKDELINEWIKKSNHDIKSADIIIKTKPDLTDIICFHCQQAVEKILKAILTKLDIPFKKTHSLVYLLDLMKNNFSIDQEIYNICEELQNYAVDIRYPDNYYEISIEETKIIYDKTLKVLNFLIQIASIEDNQ